jgi:hypothetical protein
MAPSPPPLWLVSSEIRAKRFARSGTIGIRAADGTSRDEIYVPAGHWAVRDEDGVSELPDADFAARFVAVPPDPASFAMRGRSVAASAEGSRVAVAGRAEPYAEADFVRLAVRLAPGGRPLCRLSAPFAVQARLLLEAGADGAVHLDDLRERARRLRAGIVADPALAADLGTMDAVLSGRRDVVSDGMAEIHLARPPEGLREVARAGAPDGGEPLYELDPDSVRGRIAAGVGVRPDAVVDLVHSPPYRETQMRALVRICLSPYLGDRQMEEVLALPLPPGDAGREARRALQRWLDGADLLVEGPEIAIAEMPEYGTSPVRHYRFADGIDCVVFSDVFGSYLYAWRTPPQPGPRP